MRHVVIASLNAGKAVELAALARTWGWSSTPAAQLGLRAPEETGATYEANAALKARAAAAQSGMWALADDSGLEIAALGGEPGVHTRRWADTAGGYEAAIQAAGGSAVDALDSRFICALALARPDGETLSERGTLEHELVLPGRGVGPGAWPFILLKSGRTFAELSVAERLTVHPRYAAATLLHPRIVEWLPVD